HSEGQHVPRLGDRQCDELSLAPSTVEMSHPLRPPRERFS
ncbi:MAG: hypothetical protein ACI855_000732, partial [Myxococcota bacterium]